MKYHIWVFSHLKVPEVGEGGVFWERTSDGKLDLLGVDVETVADVDAHLGSHAADQPVDLALKVHLVVNDVHIGMSWRAFDEKLLMKARPPN